ncbi:hypothetical protein ACIQXA_00775 [Streptomyces massasporeus]|uniref:hypothetical protein n=1 Tax=Streptomyces massasporeus TaxID=67324 RepID=UPI003802A88D
MTVAAAGGGFEDPSEDVLAQAAAVFGLLASLKEEGAAEPDSPATAPAAPPVSPSEPAATDGRAK